MALRDDLGKRMKTYEAVPKNYLTRRTPVAIRVDGKAFHTFTRGMKKPFDEVLNDSMSDTMMYLCKNIQGCVLGYTQSDEITLILIDYEKLETSAWYDYNVEKLCSISASMATLAFNKVFDKNVKKENLRCFAKHIELQQETRKYHSILRSAADTGALFDARCFNIPKEEVTNLVYWRQVDAIRNSIQSVGQANFSQKQLQDKSCEDIKKMLIAEKGIDWEKYPDRFKYGSCCIKEYKLVSPAVYAKEWKIDNNIPIFKNEGRDYIDKLIFI